MSPSSETSSKEITQHVDDPLGVEHTHIIHRRLSIIRRRMWVQSVFTKLAHHVFWGLVLTSGLMCFNRFVQLPTRNLLFFPLLCSIIWAISVAKKATPLSAALLVDKQLNLKERFSTAVELIDRGATDDLSRLQIHDTATIGREISCSEVARYTPPSILRWFPIPVLLIFASTAVPRMYDVPILPTLAQQRAILETAKALVQMTHNLDNPALTAKIEDAVEFPKRAEVHEIQERLSRLRDDVRNRRATLPVHEIKEATRVIAEISEKFERFRHEDASQFIDALARLARQQELSPGLREELRALFDVISRQLPINQVTTELTKQLAQVQSETLNPNSLREIVRPLTEIDKLAKNYSQLSQILAQIRSSRQRIALAEIEMDRESGSVANAKSKPGETSTTGETRGRTASDDPKFETEKRSDDPEFTKSQQQNNSLRSLHAEGVALTLKNRPSYSDNFKGVFVGFGTMHDEEQPEYMQYRGVLLNAKQHYAEALDKNNIPVRYQQLIKDYLIAITDPQQE